MPGGVAMLVGAAVVFWQDVIPLGRMATGSNSVGVLGWDLGDAFPRVAPLRFATLGSWM